MIPFLGLRHRRAVIYSLPADIVRRKKKNPPPPNLDEDREKAYRGNLSRGAVSRLKKAFENLMEISDWQSVRTFRDKKLKDGTIKKIPYNLRFRISFITLTLSAPQGDITDRQIYNICFKPFLDALRYKCPNISYVWKAEVQKNGNLHFHITTNQFVDYRWIRSNWNKHQAKLGFIRSFADKHGHSDPNSTDVKTVRQDNDLGAYMAKYICKTEDSKRRLGIKIWDCSQNLKFKEIRNLPICNAVSDWIDELVRSEKVQVIRTEQAIILQSSSDWDVSSLPRVLRESHIRYISLLKDCSCKYQRLYSRAMDNICPKSREPVRGERVAPSLAGGKSKQKVEQMQYKFDFFHYNRWSFNR